MRRSRLARGVAAFAFASVLTVAPAALSDPALDDATTALGPARTALEEVIAPIDLEETTEDVTEGLIEPVEDVLPSPTISPAPLETVDEVLETGGIDLDGGAAEEDPGTPGPGTPQEPERPEESTPGNGGTRPGEGDSPGGGSSSSGGTKAHPPSRPGPNGAGSAPADPAPRYPRGGSEGLGITPAWSPPFGAMRLLSSTDDPGLGYQTRTRTVTVPETPSTLSSGSRPVIAFRLRPVPSWVWALLPAALLALAAVGYAVFEPDVRASTVAVALSQGRTRRDRRRTLRLSLARPALAGGGQVGSTVTS